MVPGYPYFLLNRQNCTQYQGSGTVLALPVNSKGYWKGFYICVMQEHPQVVRR